MADLSNSVSSKSRKRGTCLDARSKQESVDKAPSRHVLGDDSVAPCETPCTAMEQSLLHSNKLGKPDIRQSEVLAIPRMDNITVRNNGKEGHGREKWAINRPSPKQDKTGQKYHKLTVLGYDHSYNGNRFWLCRCDCGNQTVVVNNKLKYTQSCGCRRFEAMALDQTPGQRACTKCEKVKEFPIDFQPMRKANRTSRICKTCHSKSVKIARTSDLNKYKETQKRNRRNVTLRNMRLIVKYLNSHPCVDCGETDWLVLQFDHVRGKKSFNISYRIGSYKWETIKAEIAKCDVRCANCHSIQTILRGNQLKYILDDQNPEYARIKRKGSQNPGVDRR